MVFLDVKSRIRWEGWYVEAVLICLCEHNACEPHGMFVKSRCGSQLSFSDHCAN